jgi:DNA-directed RNA polymerase subunit omega
MMNPSIEGLLDRAGSKFSLVTLSAKRAREINSYFNQLGEGLGTIVPPQVTSVARKPLSIAFEEISGGKIVPLTEEEHAAAKSKKDDKDDRGDRGRGDRGRDRGDRDRPRR